MANTRGAPAAAAKRRSQQTAAAAARPSSSNRGGEAGPSSRPSQVGQAGTSNRFILSMLHDDGTEGQRLLPQFQKVHTTKQAWAIVPTGQTRGAPEVFPRRQWQRPLVPSALARAVAAWVVEKAYACLLTHLPGHPSNHAHEFEDCCISRCPCVGGRHACKRVRRSGADAAGVAWSQDSYPRVSLGLDKHGQHVYEGMHRLMCWAAMGMPTVLDGAGSSGSPPELVRHLTPSPCAHGKHCVNPRHLVWGTHKENVADRWKTKGYQWKRRAL